MRSALDRRLVVVTGKGGVGKSTVCAALALEARRRGRRVLVCEVSPKERVSALLGAAPVGSTIGEVADGVEAVDITPWEAMREYALLVLKVRSIYTAVFENRLVRSFLRAIPSLPELLVLGKILFHVDEKLPDGRPRWDLVLFDAPATGHSLTFLRVPQVIASTAPPGPLVEEARRMQARLVDPATTAALLVTLPEQMPVAETLELFRALRDTVGVACAGLVVNGVVEARLSAAEVLRLRAAPPGLESLAQALLVREGRAALSVRCRERLAAEIEVPQIVVPFLFSDGFGRAEIERVARCLEAA